jgi:2-polyprenyl-3-methyl-5-hydroxy-6-metoxy-1,4-benzoquinol methylase
MTPLPTIAEDIEFYQKNEMQRRLTSIAEMTDDELMYRQEPYGVSQADSVCEILSPEMSILEIGSGYAWFIEKMKMKGFIHIEGVELSDAKRKMVKGRLGIDLHNFNIVQSLPPPGMEGQYDAVCLFHLLEHVPDPVLFLKRLSCFLRHGGMLILEVPNFDDYLKSECMEYNNFLYLRAHISYFSVQALERTLQMAGFSNIKIIGKQLYSIENAIYWLRNRKPFKAGMQVNLPSCLEFVNRYFKSEKEKTLTSDTLFATAELLR